MDDKLETPPCTVAMPARPGGVSPPSLHKLIDLSRPHHLLDLVGKAVGAAHGAFGLVSAEGDLQEHVTFGIEKDLALEPRRPPWGGELIRFIANQSVPIKVAVFGRE